MRRLLHSASRLPGACLALALFLGLLLPASAAPSDAPAPPASARVSPEALKAAFLVRFLNFTDWPPSTQPDAAPYLIGIAGNRAIEDELIRLADRQLVRGRRLRVVRLKNSGDLDGLHVAYFDATAPAQLDVVTAADALPLLRRRPVLTVSDAADFSSAGGMIRIFRDEKSLRFEIAPDVARESGLVFDSRLLALALIRRGEPAAPAQAAAPSK